ncbi:ABC transporter permease [Celeribacter sp. SCSIO 80788]|uniref:ABC transporter permease n=1 Tax=Celeribacter sp. SCSIO 80788 TaxID=3117013 RepID=UPI003DA1DD98
MSSLLRTRLSFRSRLSLILPPILLSVVIVLIWSWTARTGILPKWFLPSPESIFDQFISNRAMLWKHAKVTAVEAIGGCVLGAVSGLIGALVLSVIPALRDMFYPYALASRALPLVVFTPIIVVMMGRGTAPIIVVVAISTYFPVFLGMMRGLARSNQDRLELLHSFSATPAQFLWKVQFPSALPFLFSALKVSASTAFINTIVTEWIASNSGLGYLVMVSGQYFKLATMWAAIFSASFMTLALLGLIILIERLAWRYSTLATEV